MKKISLGAIILAIALVLLVDNQAFSQKLYLNAGIGYSLGTNKNPYSQWTDYYNVQQDTVYENSKYESGKFSLGQGLNVELGLGSFIGKKFSMELIGFYHNSNKHTIKRSEHTNFYDDYELDLIQESTYSGKMMGIKPSIAYWPGGENIQPYLKLGGVFGFGEMIKETHFRIFNTLPGYYPTEDYTSNFEFESQLNIGGCATIGAQIPLAAGIRFFAECTYTIINYVPTKGSYTEYKYRGIDIIDNLSISDRNFEYVNEFYTSENESENIPTKELKTAYSFSGLGLLVGLKFHIFN